MNQDKKNINTAISIEIMVTLAVAREQIIKYRTGGEVIVNNDYRIGFNDLVALAAIPEVPVTSNQILKTGKLKDMDEELLTERLEGLLQERGLVEVIKAEYFGGPNRYQKTALACDSDYVLVKFD